MKPTVLVSLALLQFVAAKVQHLKQTTQCSQHSRIGKATLCGQLCLDGEYRRPYSKLCRFYNDGCLDFDTPPSCPPTKKFVPGKPKLAKTGVVCPGEPDYSQVQWSHTEWHWSCCDCPAGYMPADQGACDRLTLSGVLSHTCVGCSEPGEVLTGDLTFGFECPVPPLLPGCGKPIGSCRVDTLCDIVLPEGAPPPSCGMNNAGLNMLKKQEGGCPKRYEIGGHVTLGYGHDCVGSGDCGPNPSSKYPEIITLKKAKETLAEDLNRVIADSKIKRWRNVHLLNSNQFSALLDFGFQAGAPNLRTFFQTTVQRGDFSRLCSDLLTSAAGTSGAKARRQLESTLCNKPTIHLSGCPPPEEPLPPPPPEPKVPPVPSLKPIVVAVPSEPVI